MTKAELASMIDAYADAKASGNKYLVQKMIEELEMALSEVCDSNTLPPMEVPKPPNELPPMPPGGPVPLPAEQDREAMLAEY